MREHLKGSKGNVVEDCRMTGRGSAGEETQTRQGKMVVVWFRSKERPCSAPGGSEPA